MTLLRSKNVEALAVCTILVWAAQVGAQEVTFVEFSDPLLFCCTEPTSGPQADEQVLNSQYALAWAVTEVNRMVHGGKRIDFLVLAGGLGLKGATRRPAERLSLLRAVLVPAVYIIPGESDVDLTTNNPLADYRSFLSELKATLNNKDVRDLTSEAPVVSGIQILGFNSTVVANQSGTYRNPAWALQEIERVAMLADGRNSIVFTHVADLDDPRQAALGAPSASSWLITPAARKVWNDLIAQPRVLAVFAGHILSSDQRVYFKDYSYALNKPSLFAVGKTWLSPPLAVVAGLSNPQPLRGFEIATVAVDGSVVAGVDWFTPPEMGSKLDDKAEKVAEARSYEQANDFEKAAAAYQQALSSTDASVRETAEVGFGRVIQRTKDVHWARLNESWLVRLAAKWWLDGLLVLAVGPLLCLLARRARLSRRLAAIALQIIPDPLVVIGPVIRASEGSPVEEFTAQLLLAIEEIRVTLDPGSGLGNAGQLSVGTVPLGNGWQSLSVPAGTKMASPPAGEDLPELKVAGIDVGAMLAWLNAFRNLFHRRIEIQVYGTIGRLQVFAVQRFAWVEEARWTIPQPGFSVDVIEASRQLAYCIIGQRYLRES